MSNEPGYVRSWDEYYNSYNDPNYLRQHYGDAPQNDPDPGYNHRNETDVLNRMLTNASSWGWSIILFGLWVVLTLAISFPLGFFAVAEARPFVLPLAAVPAWYLMKRFDRRFDRR